MGKKTVETAIQDGTQQAALEAVTGALPSLPKESQIRVLACVAILLDLDEDLRTRLAQHRYGFR